MRKIVFVSYMKNADFDLNICLLVSSIRNFAGLYTNASIWIMVPSDVTEIDQDMTIFLRSQKVELIQYDAHPMFMKIPLEELVYASATAESLAKEKFELLVWLDSNTLILHEIESILPENGKLLGYRPVHHTLIGSKIDEPLDSFWGLIYSKFSVFDKNLFPMKTHVDGNTIRPYFNAGFLICKPKNGILEYWKEEFLELAYESDFKTFYTKNAIYSIFIHQAILTGCILSKLKQNQLQELPFECNYPIHLYQNSSEEFKPKDLSMLLTVRFEELKDLEFLMSNLGSNFTQWYETVLQNTQYQKRIIKK